MAVVALASATAFLVTLRLSTDDDPGTEPNLETRAPQGTPEPTSSVDDPSLFGPEGAAVWAEFVYITVHEFELSLRIALGQQVPCASPCNIVRDTALHLAGALRWCRQRNDNTLRHERFVDPELYEPVLESYRLTCATLSDARNGLGEPADTAEWRAAAQTALDVIGPAGSVYFAAAKSRGYLPLYGTHP